MNINLLRTFLALVRYDLNFTRTAENLGISQPAVTQNIKKFEILIGTPLFRRKGRYYFQLTNKGYQILPMVKGIVEQIDRMISEKKMEDGIITLNIATPHTQIKYRLTHIVKHILQKTPHATINFHQASPDMMVNMVSSGIVDFAITTESFHLYNDIRALPCYSWGRSLVIPCEHPLKSRQITSLTDIVAYPLITNAFVCNEHSDIYTSFTRQNLEPNIVVSAADADIIKHYVRKGIGVGIISSSAKDSDDDLVFISLDHLLPSGQTTVIASRNILLSDVASEFIRLFAPHLSEELICGFVDILPALKGEDPDCVQTEV